MTGTPPRPPPPPRYEARNTDGSAGSRHLSRLDAVLPSVVTIRLRGGGPHERFAVKEFSAAARNDAKHRGPAARKHRPTEHAPEAAQPGNAAASAPPPERRGSRRPAAPAPPTAFHSKTWDNSPQIGRLPCFRAGPGLRL